MHEESKVTTYQPSNFKTLSKFMIAKSHNQMINI